MCSCKRTDSIDININVPSQHNEIPIQLPIQAFTYDKTINDTSQETVNLSPTAVINLFSICIFLKKKGLKI